MENTETEKRSAGEIVTDFNARVNEAIRMLDRRLTDIAGKALIGRLRSRLSLVRNTTGREYVLTAAGPFLIGYSEKILDRDEDFFMTVDVRATHGHEIKPEEEFVYDLIREIRILYSKAKIPERDALYDLVLGMLTDYLGFCMVTGVKL